MDTTEKLKQFFNVPENWDKHDYKIHRYSFDDLLEAAELVKESDSLPCVTQWVAVEDQLPDDCVPVLIFESNAKWVSTGYWDGEVFEWEDDKQQFYDSKKAVVSHWKPIPEPPCG